MVLPSSHHTLIDTAACRPGSGQTDFLKASPSSPAALSFLSRSSFFFFMHQGTMNLHTSGPQGPPPSLSLLPPASAQALQVRHSPSSSSFAAAFLQTGPSASAVVALAASMVLSTVNWMACAAGLVRR